MPREAAHCMTSRIFRRKTIDSRFPGSVLTIPSAESPNRRELQYKLGALAVYVHSPPPPPPPPCPPQHSQMWHWKRHFIYPLPPIFPHKTQHSLATLCKPNCSSPRSQGLNRDICKNRIRKSCYHLFLFLAKMWITRKDHPKNCENNVENKQTKRPPRCWRRGPVVGWFIIRE